MKISLEQLQTGKNLYEKINSRGPMACKRILVGSVVYTNLFYSALMSASMLSDRSPIYLQVRKRLEAYNQLKMILSEKNLLE